MGVDTGLAAQVCGGHRRGSSQQRVCAKAWPERPSTSAYGKAHGLGRLSGMLGCRLILQQQRHGHGSKQACWLRYKAVCMLSAWRKLTYDSCVCRSLGGELNATVQQAKLHLQESSIWCECLLAADMTAPDFRV